MTEIDPQTEVFRSERGRIMTMDSAYHVDARNRNRDVVVNASYCGVLPGRFIGEHRPRGAIGIDCAVGPEGASIAGLWYLEALNIPTAVADVNTVHLGDGLDLYRHGIISFYNRPAEDLGIRREMSVEEAAALMLDHDPSSPAPREVTHRTVMETGPSGRSIVCTDSIAFYLPEDVSNVLLTAGHTGRSAEQHLRDANPHGFICSDGGKGRDDAGVAGIYLVEKYGLVGATVDARTARMGSGLSTYADGVISAVNAHAAAIGVAVGMRAAEAARLMLLREPA